MSASMRASSRSPLVLCLVLFLIALALFTLVAATTGPVAGELAHLRAARAAGEWLDKVANASPRLGDGDIRDLAIGPVHANLNLGTWLSGLVWQVSFWRHDWMGELLALRFGHLLIASASAPLIFLLVSPVWGTTTAVFSTLFWIFVPRGLHEYSVASHNGSAVTAWLAILFCYTRCRTSRAFGWTVATGVAMGVGLSVSPSVALVFPLLCLHAIWMGRHDALAFIRAGRLPIPSFVLATLCVGPAMYILCTPWLWQHTGGRLVILLGELTSPDVVPALWNGMLVTSAPFPRLYTLVATFMSLPTVTLALAGAGAARWIHAAALDRARRLTRLGLQGDLAARHTEPSLGALCVLLMLFVLVWPAIAPSSLAVYPPRWQLALPPIAIASGVGLSTGLFLVRVFAKNAPWALDRVLPALTLVAVLGVPVAASVKDPASLSSAFPALAGGPETVLQSELLGVDDGGLAQQLARAIDGAHRPSVTIFCPDIPADVWEALRRFGLMTTTVRTMLSPRDVDFIAVPDSPQGRTVVLSVWNSTQKVPRLVHTVRRDKHVLLGLYAIDAQR